jgi:hypothetical protein
MDDKSSETLAAIVVSFRILGINKDDAAKAMLILEQRRAAGDEFDYEKFIADNVAKAPKPVDHAKTFQNIKAIFSNIKLPRE